MLSNKKVDYQRTIKRTEQKEAGLFDGRFKAKVIPNKKKNYEPLRISLIKGWMEASPLEKV